MLNVTGINILSTNIQALQKIFQTSQYHISAAENTITEMALSQDRLWEKRMNVSQVK